MTFEEFRTAIDLSSTDLAIIVVLNDTKEIVAYDSEGVFRKAEFQKFCKSSENQYDVDNLEIHHIYGGVDEWNDPILKVVCYVYTDEHGNIVEGIRGEAK